MENYGGATVDENSARGNCDFTEQIMRVPLTSKYCQKYIDKLIRLEKCGIFEKEEVNPQYIKDFARKVKRESNGEIILDISGLYR